MTSPAPEGETTTERTPLLRLSRDGDESRDRWWSPMYTVVVLGCVGLVVEYSQRVSLSVAIVAMVSTPAIYDTTTNTSLVCPNNTVNTVSYTPPHKGEFDWNRQTQGLVLGAFFWGYATTNMLGGRASEYLGGKLVVGMGVLASSFFTLISPICAQASVGVFITCRIMLGAVQGVILPAMSVLLASWVVPSERTKYSAFVFSGLQLGTVVGMVVSGWLCSTNFLSGWPSAFYVFGVTGVIWSFFWCSCIYELPEDHPNVPACVLRNLLEQKSSVRNAEISAVPWGDMATSVPFWALMAVSLGNDYGYYTLVTEMPTYLYDIQHFDLSKNGQVSALPYLLMWLWSQGWSQLSHTLVAKGALSIVSVRKLSMAVAFYGAMLALAGMAFVYCDAVLAVVLLCVAVMLSGSVSSGYMCSVQDLAPNLAGTLMGLSNTVGALTGIASPAITGYLTEEQDSLWAWRTVFLVGAGMYLVTCTIYIIFISADVQPWNEPKPLEGDSVTDEETTSSSSLLPPDAHRP